MKKLGMLLLVLLSLQVLALESLQGLSRRIELELNGESLPFVITDYGDYAAYYRVDGYYDHEYRVRIALGAEGYGDIEIITWDERYFFEFQIDENTFEGSTLEGSVGEITKRGNSFDSDNYYEIYQHVERVENEKPATLKIVNFFAKKESMRVGFKKTITGPINYRPCDGCEHGDQMLVNGEVNVVTQSFGEEFYEEGCNDGMHPWMEQALELEIPFTWKGTVNYAIGDLFEGVGDFSLAHEGKLYVGTNSNNIVRRFFESMIYKAAIKTDQDPLQAWEEIKKNGKIESYENGVVTFKYRNIEVKTNILK